REYRAKRTQVLQPRRVRHGPRLDPGTEFLPCLNRLLSGRRKRVYTVTARPVARKGFFYRMSHRFRNVRMFAALRMSAVMGMSLGPLERLAPAMIFAWTFLWLLRIVGAAVGRIGLRRSAPRAPGGRRYASGPGLLLGTRPVIFPTGIGRQSAKL